MDSNSLLSVFAQKEATRFKVKTGVFLFLVVEEQVLLLRRYKTGIDDGRYVVPMGGHEGGEPLTASIIREASEETNIQLKTENLSVCHVMHRFHPMPEGLSFEQIDVFFRAEIYEGHIENLEPHKCDELKFYPVTALPSNTAPFIQYAIECMVKGQFFSEFGWDCMS